MNVVQNRRRANQFLATLLCAMTLVCVTACGDDSKNADNGKADSSTGGDGGTPSDDDVGPPIKLGEAISAPDKTWTWVDFPNTHCMDDSATGLGIKLNPASDKAIIVIQGGGACFNDTTCATAVNQNGFKAGQLTGVTDTGLLKSEDADNPFKDWNMVFVQIGRAHV